MKPEDLKKVLIKQLLLQASSNLLKLQESTASISEGATSSEAKQEGKYDTRALLDSYLAGAQGARVKQLEAEISAIQKIKINFAVSHSVQIGSLVTIEYSDTSLTKKYFILPVLGGYQIEVNPKEGLVMTLTPETPLGKQLLSKSIGENVSINTEQNFELINII